VRYFGLQSSELNWPRPSYASISGRMMELHYGEGWDRRYTVVAAVNPCVLCGACACAVHACVMNFPHCCCCGGVDSINILRGGWVDG
jgi:hypothetical protein